MMENSGGGDPNCAYYTYIYIYRNVTIKSPIQLLYINKKVKKVRF
jgi:hypothetical protein